jgi:hypothetical protein
MQPKANGCPLCKRAMVPRVTFNKFFGSKYIRKGEKWLITKGGKK